MRPHVLPGLVWLGTFPTMAWVLHGHGVAGKFAAMAVATLAWWLLAARESRLPR